MKKANENQETSYATADTLAAWKKEHGDIHMIEVKDKTGKTYVAYLKSPDRNVTAQVLSLEAAKKPLESGECIVNNCWIGGDQEIKTVEALNMAVAMQARNIVDIPDSVLKKV